MREDDLAFHGVFGWAALGNPLNAVMSLHLGLSTSADSVRFCNIASCKKRRAGGIAVSVELKRQKFELEVVIYTRKKGLARELPQNAVKMLENPS